MLSFVLILLHIKRQKKLFTVVEDNSFFRNYKIKEEINHLIGSIESLVCCCCWRNSIDSVRISSNLLCESIFVNRFEKNTLEIVKHGINSDSK